MTRGEFGVVRPRALLLVLVIAVTVAGSGPVVGSQHYDVTASPSVDTPTRTVSFQGDSFTVSELGRVDPGESVSADVVAPTDEAYSVSLYNADRQELEEHDGVGSDSFTFATAHQDGTEYEPGTYVLAVEDNGFQAVTPVVVSGYHVSVSAPNEAVPDSEVTVEADVTTVDDSEPIDQVEVVIGNEDDERRETLADDGNGDYGASFNLDTLPAGDYSIYVVVQGADDVLGRQEVLGVSDSQSFEVTQETTEPTTSEDESDSGGGGGSGGSGGGGGAAPSDSTTESADPSTDSPSPTDATPTDAVESTAGPNSATDGTTSEGDLRQSSTTTDDSAITPNAPTTAAPPTTSPGQSLGVVPPLVALLLAVALLRRRG